MSLYDKYSVRYETIKAMDKVKNKSGIQIEVIEV